MSVLVAVRLDEEMVSKVDAKGKRTEVIKAALEMYLSPKPEPPTVRAVESAKPSPSGYQHDPSKCRTYRCGLCAVAKSRL